MNTRANFWLGLVLALVLSGGVRAATPASGDDRTAIRALVRSFVEANKKGDRKAFEALLAKKARESQDSNSGSIPPDPDMTYRIGEPLFNAAAVSIKIDSPNMHFDGAALVLRQEVGQWRVCGGGLGDAESLGGPATAQAAAVKAVALSFLKATQAPDKKAAERFLTEGARQFQRGRLDEMGFGDTNATYTLGTPTIDLAVVPFYGVTKGQDEMPVLLILTREMNQWKLLSLVMGESMEEPVKDTGKPKSPAGGIAKWGGEPMPSAAQPPRVAPPLEAVTVAAYEAGWKPDFSAAGQSASQLLPRLAKALGLQIEMPRDPALGKAVTMDFTGRSTLECIEAVCREVGYYPTYARAMVALRKGTRLRPAVFAGPFMVEIEDVVQDLATATGALKFRVYAAGLASAVRESLSFNSYSLQPLTGTRGEDIATQDSGISFGMADGDEQTPSTFLAHDGVALRNLLRSVTGIKGPHMKLTVRVPTRVDIVRFNRMVTGETQRAGGVTATLKQVSGDGKTAGVLITGTAAGSGVQVVAMDAAGKPIEEVQHGGSGGGDTYEAEVGVVARIATLTVRVPAFQEVAYDAQFADIPLKPGLIDKLPAVTFAGHDAPVTVQFVAITGEPGFRNVKVRIANHASKPLRRVQFTLTHLDAAGKTVGEVKSDDWRASGGETIARGATAEPEVMDFFMPAETKSVRTAMDKVTFADGTVWPEPASASAPPHTSPAATGLPTLPAPGAQKLEGNWSGHTITPIAGDCYRFESPPGTWSWHGAGLKVGNNLIGTGRFLSPKTPAQGVLFHATFAGDKMHLNLIYMTDGEGNLLPINAPWSSTDLTLSRPLATPSSTAGDLKHVFHGVWSGHAFKTVKDDLLRVESPPGADAWSGVAVAWKNRCYGAVKFARDSKVAFLHIEQKDKTALGHLVPITDGQGMLNAIPRGVRDDVHDIAR